MNGDEVTERVQLLRARMAEGGVPAQLANSFTRYLEHGLHPGSWADAVLRNDLTTAVLVSDSAVLAHLGAIVVALFHGAPVPAWGTDARVTGWRAAGGLRGMQSAAQGLTAPEQATDTG